MKQNNNKTFRKCIFFILALLITNFVYTQNQKYKADLPDIDSTGFYKILLTPSVTGRSEHGLADIRIMDKAGKETPFITRSAEAEFVEKDFREYPIAAKLKGADEQTHVIINNDKREKLDHLLLFIKNTQAQRMVTLSGGEDTTSWYVIKENLLLENYFNNSTDGSFIQSITFPPVDYRFLKITILGKGVLPVNFMKTGVYKEQYKSGNMVKLPPPAFTVFDSSDKRTYVNITFHEPFPVSKLKLNIRGPKFYNRDVTAYIGTTVGSPVAHYSLSSNQEPVLSLNVKAKQLLLVIENNDNPPLSILAIDAWQLSKYLLAYLQQESNYSLLFGDSLATSPAYDLSFFADSIPGNIAEISPLGIQRINANIVRQDEKGSKVFLLWTVIIAVLALLIYASYKIVGDVEKKKAKE
jgi:hypothetical protein